MRRAKIVATFGPASCEYNNVLSILNAGVDVARINMSHGDYKIHQLTCENIRKASKKLNKSVAIMADLQGPKIRLGKFIKGPHKLKAGDIFTISTEDNIQGTQTICSTTFKNLPLDVQIGDSILVDDGKVLLKVISIHDKEVITKVKIPGAVSNNKGINLPGTSVNISSLSYKDKNDLQWSINHAIDMIALSFVRNAQDINKVYKIMDQIGKRLPIIAKIEKPQAVDNLCEIIDSCDAIMIARGDLGVELPLEKVPIIQKKAIEIARRWAKPVIVATQVLESMIDNPRPTRAEASDCANAVLDGADAVMLSGETSIGRYPIGTVSTMSKIIQSTEDHGLDRIPPLGTYPKTLGGAITRAALEIADQVNAKAICIFTQSGDSAKRLSRLRPVRPIFAITPKEKVWFQMSLIWGINPILAKMIYKFDQLADLVDKELTKQTLYKIKKDDLIIIVSGSPPGASGSTNCLQLHKIK